MIGNHVDAVSNFSPPRCDAALNRPLISVIIAAYNAASCITVAIESVLCQTHQEFEILVVDDGSTDSTPDIVERLRNEDRRICLLRMEQNRGVSVARNLGLLHAKGEWIAVLDADDRFSPMRLERLVSIGMEHSLDLVSDNLEMRDFHTGELKGSAFPDIWICCGKDITPEFFVERDLPGMFRRELGYMKPLIRAAFLKQHDIRYAPDIRSGEDFLLYLECLAKGGRLRLISERLYIYSLRSGSVSSVRNANLELRRGNQILLEKVGAEQTYLGDLLRLRQTLIEYEIFCWRLKTGKWWHAIPAAARVQRSFLLRKLSSALLRRLRLRPVNPAMIALENLRTRYQTLEP